MHFDTKTKYDRLGFAGTSKDQWRRTARISLVFLAIGLLFAYYANQFLTTYHICPQHMCEKIVTIK